MNNCEVISDKKKNLWTIINSRFLSFLLFPFRGFFQMEPGKRKSISGLQGGSRTLVEFQNKETTFPYHAFTLSFARVQVALANRKRKVDT